MTEGYTPFEESIPEEEKRKETLDQLFCSKLSPEDGERLYTQGVKNIEERLAGVSPLHLEKFAETLSREDNPSTEETEDDPLISADRYTLYNAYRQLRSEGFSHEEVAELCQSASCGQTEEALSGKIIDERAQANEFIAQHGEKIARADEALAYFTQQVQGENSSYQKPQALFTGKYQNLIIFSGNNSSNEITPSSSSLYSTGENVVLVNVKDLASHYEFDEEKVAQIIHTYVHENVHGIGANVVENGSEYSPLNPTSAKKLHSGFFHTSEDGQKHLLYNLNEATTEYFARQLSRNAGVEKFQGMYQPQVECLEKLVIYLEEGNSIGIEERERALREQYGSTSGVGDLRAQLENSIGPYALEVCDTLFDISEEFDQFLSSLQTLKKGGRVEQELWVSAQRFRAYHPELSLPEITRAYPFLHFGIRAYDKVANKVIWKEDDTELI